MTTLHAPGSMRPIAWSGAIATSAHRYWRALAQAEQAF